MIEWRLVNARRWTGFDLPETNFNPRQRRRQCHQKRFCAKGFHWDKVSDESLVGPFSHSPLGWEPFLMVEQRSNDRVAVCLPHKPHAACLRYTSHTRLVLATTHFAAQATRGLCSLQKHTRLVLVTQAARVRCTSHTWLAFATPLLRCSTIKNGSRPSGE